MDRMSRMRRAPSALLAATLALAVACSRDGSSVESSSTDPPTSIADTTSTTAAHDTGTGSTNAPPDSTSTTAPPTSSPTPPPPTTPPPAGSGVSGTVTAGPTCPVAQAENPCDPRPVDADVEARTSAGTLVAATHTGSAGTYELQLAPATYTLAAATGSAPLPRCTPITITVSSGKTTQANISCDTGIR